MSFLADTNILSELRKRERCNPGVRAWFSATPFAEIYVSIINVLELRIGVEQMEHRDPVQGRGLRHWVEGTIIARLADRTLLVTPEVALTCARLHVPDPAPLADSLIAATALVHGLTVVTHNTKDFTRFPAPIFDPWSA